MAHYSGPAHKAAPRHLGRGYADPEPFGVVPRMSAKASQSTVCLKLYLIGAFRVTDSAGRVLVLRSRKAQALLALLALSPRGERNRVWLRDKLWSGSDERKSATSLRQILFEIRRDLGGLADRALEIGPQTISLRPGRVWIDHAACIETPSQFSELRLTSETDLLEGFDIVDPEFEDWLTMERGLWAERAEQLSAAPSVVQLTPRMAESSRPKETSLALMRTIMHGSDPLCLHLADRVMEGVAGSLRELQPVTIHDLRDQHGAIEDLAASSRTEFYCRLRLLRIGDQLTLSLLVHSVSRMALEWSQSINCKIDDLIAYDGQLLQGFIAQNVDRLARTLLSAQDTGDAMADQRRSGYAAMNLIFRADKSALDLAMDILRPSSAPVCDLHGALRAYVSSFRIGDNLGSLSEQALRVLRDDAGGEMDRSPFNSIALACFGHVLGYVFQEHEAAGRILERAVRLNPAQAFAWDHYALHKIYTGDYAAARKASERAVTLGAYSPIAYSYEATLAMAATLSGDLDRAIMAGQSALHKQPRFKPTQRYLMLAHSARGDRDQAEQLRDRLLISDPDFRHADVQSLRFGAKVLETAPVVRTELRKLLA